MVIEEEWRPVVGYEGLYEVSSYGRVRSLDKYVKGKGESYWLHKGRVLSPSIKPEGYLIVRLQRRTFYIHRLVTEAFIPNPDNLPEVNHKDEDKTNNRVENLEWCDHKYNMNYGTRNIRAKETAIKNGYWSGLSREESKKKYYQDNKDKIKEYRKEYYQDNKESIKESKKKYYYDNQDNFILKRKEMKDYYKEYLHKYYQDHKEERRLYMRDYQRKHKKTV